MFRWVALWWVGSGARRPSPSPSEHGPKPWKGVIPGLLLPSSKEDLSKLWERAFPPQSRVRAGARSADVTSPAPSCPSALLPATLTGPSPALVAPPEWGAQACQLSPQTWQSSPSGVPLAEQSPERSLLGRAVCVPTSEPSRVLFPLPGGPALPLLRFFVPAACFQCHPTLKQSPGLRPTSLPSEGPCSVPQEGIWPSVDEPTLSCPRPPCPRPQVGPFQC